MRCISKLKEITTKRRGSLDTLQEQMEQTILKLKLAVKHHMDCQKTQKILQLVAKETQEELTYHLREIVDLALESVYGEHSYSFEIEFQAKKGKTEAVIWFKRDGYKIDIIQEGGGGVADIGSFSLRIAMWEVKTDKTRATFILDEPFKYVSEDLQPLAAEILRQLSHKLNIQMIIVTHQEHQKKIADKLFKVRWKSKKRRSHVEVCE